MRESDLLQFIYATSSAGVSKNIELGPGDDMAIVRIGGQRILVAVDKIIDSIHFDSATASLQRIARKALTRNLSDVAAMAAKPVAALVSASLPKEMSEAQAQKLFDFLQQTGEQFGCPVIGGDISIYDGKLALSVTVIAEPEAIEPVLRKGAKAGDGVYVTGELGGSLEEVNGYIHNLDFAPQLEIACQLAGNPQTRPHCMIDISDGLGKDLERLCAAADNGNSAFGAIIEIEKLPISSAAKQASGKSGKEAWKHAIGDGEDYQLLFTAPDGAIPAQLENVVISRVGKIVELKNKNEPRISFVNKNGNIENVSNLGWEHTADLKGSGVFFAKHSSSHSGKRLPTPLNSLESTSVEQTMEIGAELARSLKPGAVVGLVGELGAGKTQFVRGMALAMGINPKAVTSPTFVLMQEYEPEDDTKVDTVLVHIDAYRLKENQADPSAALSAIGWENDGKQLRQNAIVAIEWADLVRDCLDEETVFVRMEHLGASRRIEIARPK